MTKLNAALLILFLATALVAPAQVDEDSFANAYTFLGADEDLQLSVVEGSILLGYVNTHGLGEPDSHLLLAMLFQKGTIQGDEVYLITKPLHGLRYEFKRKVRRGTARPMP